MLRRQTDPQLQLPQAADHRRKYLVDGVGVRARPLRDLVAELAPIALEETDRARRRRVPRLGGEDAEQAGVVAGRAIERVVLPLVAVVRGR